MTLILQYDARHRDILLIMRLTEKSYVYINETVSI